MTNLSSEHAPAMRAQAALELLTATSSPLITAQTREQFERLVLSNPRAVHRTGGPAHLTASAIVLDSACEHVALVWHRKGRFWVQPGGHIETGDADLEAAARREVAEELGLHDLQRIGDGPVMLHRHRLAAAFGRCHEHFDVQYVLRTAREAAQQPLGICAETPEAIWVPWPARGSGGERSVESFPDECVPDVPVTLSALAPHLRALMPPAHDSGTAPS